MSDFILYAATIQEMKMMHPMATPTPIPALAPTLRPELVGSEDEVGRVEVVVLLAVPVCRSLPVVSVTVEVVLLHSGSPSTFRTTGPWAST